MVETKNSNAKLVNEMLPEVRTTRMNVESFDSMKIIDSLMRETNINRNAAKKVTKIVLKRIIRSNVAWLSGPQIREMCSSVLAEIGLLEERKRYTRIGMPLMDYEKLLTKGLKENANQYNNPESIHTWAADRISAEYALLRLLTDEQAKAHLRGDIHVHMLRYFDLRPFCQQWDLRMILKHGLPPTQWRHSAISKPANHAIVAVLHAAKWLGIVQGEYSGGQGYDNFTAFLAPYLKNATYQEAKQLAQCFIFESNQIYAARGAQVPFTSITCTPTIPERIFEVPAVSFGGTIDGVYGDYIDECSMFFRAISEVYAKGDGTGKLFNFPKHEIKLKKEWMKEFEDDYLFLSREAAKFGTPYYLNLCASWMPDGVSSQCCRIIFTPEGMKKYCQDLEIFEYDKYFQNNGSLQSVSINLPRCAYRANGDDEKIIEVLDQNLNFARDILLKKLDIVKQAMENNLIPLCASKINGVPLLDLRKQSLSIGFVGLNECVKAHTGYELHEDQGAFEFGKRIITHMANRCEEFSVLNSIKFSLWEQPAESSAGRFAKLDLIHYKDQAIPLGGLPDNAYYTNSDHLNYAANISLIERIERQAEFHPIVINGVITHIWLGEAHPNAEGLWKLTKAISNTETGYFAFTKDFTQCLSCLKFMSGIYNSCPNCGAPSEQLEWWSRVTGYYSRVKMYPTSKVSEWKQRKRYDLDINDLDHEFW